MSNGFTIPELQEIIGELKSALIRVAATGGVTSYTIKSGQGSTTVHAASLADIQDSLTYFTGLLNELVEIESGSNMVYIRDVGI